MEIFVIWTIKFLKLLAMFCGSYGVAIIVLTLIMRAAMWPLNVAQQRNMRTMQSLQPKLKAIQDRYKSNPQVMQQKMMEIYKENKFNPAGGCMPLIIQMPIFILLYTSLMSPQFIQIAGDSKFLFINRLDTTLRASAGVSNDGTMGVSVNDKFMPGKVAKVYIDDEVIDNIKINEPKNAMEVQGGIKPGETMEIRFSLDHLSPGLKYSQLTKVTKADIVITDVNTRENETVTFERKNEDYLVGSIPTIPVNNSLHWDVLLLIVIFGVTMWLSQKLMMAMNNSSSKDMDPAQQAIQKSMGTFMPIMIMATFIMIPIPAGVFIYLIVSNIVQVVQTVIVNKQIDAETEAKKAEVTDSDLANAKNVTKD